MNENCVKIIDFKQIGKVSFFRRSSARNLKIIIRPFREVHVTVPGTLSLEKAKAFVDEKIPWIIKSQNRLTIYEKRVTRFDFETVFKTRYHELKLQTHPKATVRTIIGNGQVNVVFPDFANIEDPRIQAAIRRGISQALKLEAARFLPERLEMLSKGNGLNYKKLTIRNNKSRWGSCSRDNHISLNIHLMRLPQHLCDYVILHELAHTIHKNHQKGFWNFLDSICLGKAREYDRELNKWSPVVW